MLAIFGCLQAQQTVVFEDDFESYEDGVSLGNVDYVIWEGSAVVSDVTIDGGTANSDDKYVKCNSGTTKMYYLRKNLTLIEGKAYNFEIYAKTPNGGEYRIGYKLGANTAVFSNYMTNSEWVKSSISFTVGAGGESAVLMVNSKVGANVDVDDFKLIGDFSSGVPEKTISDYSIVKAGNGKYRISGSENMVSYTIYTLCGQQLMCSKARLNVLDLSKFSKGIYLLKIQDSQDSERLFKLLND